MGMNERLRILGIMALSALLIFGVALNIHRALAAEPASAVALKQPPNADVQLVDARYTRVPEHAADDELSDIKQGMGDSLSLPTILWVLGSALLAMIGYKRMRNTNDSQQD